MYVAEMQTMCDQLCEELQSLAGQTGIDIARDVMYTIHNRLNGCTKPIYTMIFMRAAAFGMQTNTLIREGETNLSDDNWIDFVDTIVRKH